MKPFRVVDGQSSFFGGLNTTADPMQLGPDEVSDATNCRVTQFGGMTARRGSERTHTSAIVVSATVQGGAFWTHAGTNVVVVTGGVYTATATTLATTSMVWTSVAASGLSDSTIPTFAEFVDVSGNSAMYIADGGPLNRVVGSTLTTNLAGTPNVGYVVVYNQRLWGISGNDETLYYSALNNGDSLGIVADGGGSAVIRTFAHQKLKALLPLGNSLLLFHERGISAFTGWSQDDFNVATGTRGISPDVGTPYPHAIATVENVGYFLTERGIYAATESGVREISRKIEKTIIDSDQTNWSRARAVHSPLTREVWFYLPDLGMYVYNYRLNCWTGPWDGLIVSSQARALWLSKDMGTNAPIVLLGGRDGFVRWYDVGQKDDVDAAGGTGDAVTFSLKTRPFWYSDPTDYVHLRWGWLTGDLNNNNATVFGWSTPFDSTVVTLTTGLLGEVTTPVPGTGRIAAWGSGRVPHYVVVSGTTTSGIPTISALRLEGISYRGRAANVT